MEENKETTSVNHDNVTTSETKPKDKKVKSKVVKVQADRKVSFGKVNGRLFHFNQGEVKELEYTGEYANCIDKGVSSGFLKIIK